MASLADKVFEDYKGIQPSADFVNNQIRTYVDGRMMKEYGSFLKVRTASETVDKIRKLANKAGLIIGDVSDDQSFFVSDEDLGMNGAYGNACALVKPGKSSAPLRIVASHIDTPCLSLTPQPVYFEIDALAQNFCPSFSLITDSYGGIRPEDWYGMDVKIVGNVFKNGKKGKKIEIPGVIKHKSLHVDDGDEKKGYYGLKVDTGFRELNDLHKALGVKDGMELGSSKFYVVPNIGGKNLFIVGNDMIAYGQDDRSCAWASLDAFLRTQKHTDNTTISFFLDQEEVGGKASSAGYRGFFESVIKETIKATRGSKFYKNLDMPLDLSKSLMGDMPLIISDVDVSMGPLEIEQCNLDSSLDLFNAIKQGWGFFINAQGPEWDVSHASVEHISRISSLMNKGFGKKSKSRYQVVGNLNTKDSDFSSATAADIFSKYAPCVVMGVGVVGLHSPRSESVNKYDLYWLKRGLELFFKS
jgi:aspartyl aminopeptidase|tara:strand:- start:496 stop:1908 length:1413 start_codon:yes stop_codon:yes gene_type:complete